MKVLVLSCNTGGGHNTAARAVMEEFGRRGVECEMRDALAFAGELTSRVVSNTYIRMATDAPKVFGKIYQASETLTVPHIKSAVYMANMTYSRRLAKYINENGFDAVLTSHIFPAQALTHIKKHEMIEAKIYFIATDYTCYPFSGETNMDMYFVAHSDIISQYVERGVALEKLQPTGIPISGRFADRPDKKTAREKLGIGDGKKLFLVMTGSMGAGSVKPVIETIADGGNENTLIYIMTGRNEKMKAEVEEIHARDPRVVAIPFTTEVPLYMSAADVLMTKPGGLSTTEAAVSNIPLVLSAPIPGCETANAEFFKENGMAVVVRDEEAAAHAALWLAADEKKSADMVRAQASIINPHAAADICDMVMKNADA